MLRRLWEIIKARLVPMSEPEITKPKQVDENAVRLGWRIWWW